MSYINKVQVVGGQQNDFNDNFLFGQATDDVFTLVATDASCKKSGGKSFVSVITPVNNGMQVFLYIMSYCKSVATKTPWVYLAKYCPLFYLS